MRKTSCENSEFLLHAMLAISSQHLAKKNNSMVLATEMRNHQATALRLFAQALSDTPAVQLLDALLLLVNFEVSCQAVNVPHTVLTAHHRQRKPPQVRGRSTFVERRNCSRAWAVLPSVSGAREFVRKWRCWSGTLA